MVTLLFINNRLVDSSCKPNNIHNGLPAIFLVFYLRYLLSAIRRMLEELYSVYLPKKAHPWCYISLDINPQNIDVNIHPTKHEVRFLHEDAIIERMRFALDEKLTSSNASRTFYLQARLPKADITKEVLEEVLPEYNKGNPDKNSKKIHPREMVRTDSSDQKLDKFNFTIHSAVACDKSDDDPFAEKFTHNVESESVNPETSLREDVSHHRNVENAFADDKCREKDPSLNLNATEHNSLPDIEETLNNDTATNWSDILNNITSSSSKPQDTCDPITSMQDVNKSTENTFTENAMCDISEILRDLDDTAMDNSAEDKSVDIVADKARKQVYQYFGNKDIIDGSRKKSSEEEEEEEGQNKVQDTNDNEKEGECSESTSQNASQSQNVLSTRENASNEFVKSPGQFKSYSVNSFKHEVKLTSILKLRKEVEDECHVGLREILSNLTFVGCVDPTSALIQSGVNLYICNTRKLA